MGAYPAQRKPPRKPLEPVSCLCGCGELVVGRSRTRGARYVKGHYPPQTKPVPVAQPCACGCGVMTKPGSKFRAGHFLKAKSQQQRSQSVLSVEQVEDGLAEPLTSSCARCGWRASGPARETLAAFREHRCVAETLAATA